MFYIVSGVSKYQFFDVIVIIIVIIIIIVVAEVIFLKFFILDEINLNVL